MANERMLIRAVSFTLLGCAAALSAVHTHAKDRNTHSATHEIEMSREHRKGKRQNRVPTARVPAATVNVSARGTFRSPKKVALVLTAVEEAAKERGLRHVGSVPIPEGEAKRLHAAPGDVHRLWLCREGEAASGPCLISVTVYRPADGQDMTRISYRVWALPEASHDELSTAEELAEQVLAAVL